MTLNTGSDQSTVDDGVSFDRADDKRSKNEVINRGNGIFGDANQTHNKMV